MWSESLLLVDAFIMFRLAAGICSLNYSCAVHLYRNLQVLSAIPFDVHGKAAFLQDKCTPKFLYISCKYKAFLQKAFVRTHRFGSWNEVNLAVCC